MAYQFNGEFAVQRGLDETYDFLTDPRRFAPLLPDFESLDVQNGENFAVRVKVGISHIRGSATVKLRLAEQDRPARARYTGNADVAAGGKVELSAAFDFAPAENGTRVTWNAQAQMFGRLASIAGGLLEPLARKNVQKVIDGIQRALNAPAAAQSGESTGDISGNGGATGGAAA